MTSKSKNYAIGLLPITNEICIGEINQKNMWLHRKEVTLEAIEVVAKHILNREKASAGETAVLEISDGEKKLFSIKVTKHQ